MKIHSLKIRRSSVGRLIPFDRIYLVNYEDREVIKKLFRYAIVMPLLGAMKTVIRDQRLEIHLSRGHERTTEVHHFPMVTGATPYKIGDVLDFENEKWVVVVPLLRKALRDSNELHPKYLTSNKWVFRGNTVVTKRRHKTKLQVRMGKKGTPEVAPKDDAPAAFNKQAYLQTPERDVKPPCLFCPRMILHQNGECNLGDIHCYSSLPLGLKKELLEPEPEGDAVDGQLPEHGAGNV